MKTREKFLSIILGVCVMSALAAAPAGAGEAVDYEATGPDKYTIHHNGKPGELQTLRSEDGFIWSGGAVAPSGSDSGVSGSLAGNTVTATGSGGAILDGGVFGAFDGRITETNESVRNNSVRISGGMFTIKGDVIGGLSGNAPVTGNTVTINGINNDDAVSGARGIIGGIGDSPNTSDVTGNTVTINGSNISIPGDSNIYGGASYNGGNVKNNTVTIRDSRISGVDIRIFGGWCDSDSDGDGDDVTGNTVTISGTTTITGESRVLRGGYHYSNYNGGPNNDIFTDNTLVLDKTRYLEVDSVENFEYLSFTLPGNFSVGSTGDAMITVTGGANLTGNDNRSSVIKAIDVEAGRSLQKGDEIVLISAGTLTTNSGLTGKVTGRQDNTDYDFEIIRRDNKLIARVVDVREGPNEPNEPNEPGGGGCDTGASVILPLFAAATLLYRRKKM